MKAALLTEPQKIEIVDTDVPDVGEGHVLVRVVACGLCGTDLHTLSGQNALVRYPAIPGHEFVGVIEAVAEGVTSVTVGDRVAVDPSRSCGHCIKCRSGWPNLCPDKGGHGSRYPGGFSEYVVAREESVVALAPEVSWERAVLAEPLACVLHGMDRLGPVLGKKTLVYGAGAIGMLAASLLRDAGAQVQVVELSDTRRGIARSWNLPCEAAASDFSDDTGWDVVVDATGVPAAIQEAITLVRRGGTMLMLGVAPPEQTIELSPYRVNWHELTIIGSMAIRLSFQRAVELLPHINAPLESLITHVLPLDALEEGVGLIRSKHAMKVVVTPTDSGNLTAHRPETEQQ